MTRVSTGANPSSERCGRVAAGVGARAVAGVLNSGVGEPPRVYEQGREDTELRKVDGKWLISKRYISSDSGLPDRFDETYEPRGNPLED
jgi:hypothetical protein